MKKYTLKRILTSLFTLLAILLVLFILMQLMPGSPFNDEKLTPDMRAALYAKYGLDQPIYIQFFRYVGNMLRGDLGVSYNISKNTPISQLIQSRLPISIQVGGMAVTLGAAVGLVLGIGAYLVGPWVLQVYSSDPEVIAYGLERMLLVCTPYALCGVMHVLVGAMRGLGSSLTPMVVSIFGVCVLRVVWIYTVFPLDPSFAMLFLSYPVTWAVTAAIEVVCFFVIRKKAIARAGGMAADAD